MNRLSESEPPSELELNQAQIIPGKLVPLLIVQGFDEEANIRHLGLIAIISIGIFISFDKYPE